MHCDEASRDSTCSAGHELTASSAQPLCDCLDGCMPTPLTMVVSPCRRTMTSHYIRASPSARVCGLCAVAGLLQRRMSLATGSRFSPLIRYRLGHTRTSIVPYLHSDAAARPLSLPSFLHAARTRMASSSLVASFFLLCSFPPLWS